MSFTKAFQYPVLILLIAGFAINACSSAEETSAASNNEADSYAPYLNSITSDFLEEHIHFFAGDQMAGRQTGTPEKEEAAYYLKEFQDELGLTPAGDDDSFFQKFELDTRRVDHIAFDAWQLNEEDTVMVDESVLRPGEAASFTRMFGGENPVEGEIVFAGYGAVDHERGVDHLDGDLEDKWVMVFNEIPNVVDGDTLVTPEFESRARFNEIMERRGAAGVLVITTDDSGEYREQSYNSSYELEQPVGIGLSYMGGVRDRFQPAYMSVSPEMAAAFLDIEPNEIAEKKQRLTDEIDAFTPRQTGYGLSSRPEVVDETIEERNVAALLEGSDPDLKDEVIVITAHYDHLGVGAPDDEGDRIYNGADDNASGSIGMLAKARALKQAAEDGNRPDRSVLFLHVGAEEWGLLGSRYYSDHPTVPEENIIANINMDMIGRWDERHEEQGDSNYVYIIGAEIISSDLNNKLKQANQWSSELELNMRYNDLDDPNRFYRRSDHWSFGRLEIPFIFFFSGVHEDYHQPGDTPDKLLYNTLSERVRLITATAVEIANADEAPEIDSQEFLDRTQ